MIAIIATSVLSVGIGGWALWLVIRAQRKEHRERLAGKLAAQHRNDLRWVDDNCPCASCGGEATRTHYDAEARVFICVDRELCRQTMIFRSMLESMA